MQHFIQSLIQYLFLDLLLHISGVLTVHSQLIQAPQLCGQLVLYIHGVQKKYVNNDYKSYALETVHVNNSKAYFMAFTLQNTSESESENKRQNVHFPM